jgi:hypothetical protein
MHIVYFLTSAILFPVAMFVDMSTKTAAFMVVLSIVSLLLGAGKLINDRLGSQSRSDQHILSPEELYHLQQQAKKSADPDKPEAP